MAYSKLRIGIILDSYKISHWKFLLLKTIKNSNFSEISAIILNKNQFHSTIHRTELVRGNRLTITNFLNNSAEKIFKKIEEKKVLAAPNALEIKNSEELLKNNSKNLQDIEKNIGKYHLDILLNLSTEKLEGKITESSKYGVWSIYNGGDYFKRKEPLGFWEILEENPITSSILEILPSANKNGYLIDKSYSATNFLSVNRNKNFSYWKSSDLIIRNIKKLNEIGERKFFQKIKDVSINLESYDKIITKKPNYQDYVKITNLMMKKRKEVKTYEKKFFDQWILMYKFNDKISMSFQNFKKIIPPKDRFWADPFVLYRDNQYYVFFEEFLNKKGYISFIHIDKQGNYSTSKKVLERPYHLSYPFIFNFDDQLYMIPESQSKKTIELYKCMDFPSKWQFEKILFKNLDAVDTTLFFHKDKWWLFTGVRTNDKLQSWDDLFLFYSDNPINENWSSHPLNPIITDLRKSRPAGKIFEKNNVIFRSAQNSSYGYGSGLSINEIEKIDDEEYVENEIESFLPKWDEKITGIHTLNYDNGLTVIDSKLQRKL